MRSILIIGAAGQLGTEIRRVFADRTLTVPSHAEAPIEDLAQMAAILANVRPDLVINCSAFHQVDQCEAEPDRAFAVNTTAVGRLAKVCAEQDIAFATMSTDYVFSGDDARAYTEEDPARPKSVYGISKLAGEHYALEANSRTFVFRLSGVFGRTGYSNKGPTFVERMISMAERGEPIKVVDNIVFSPTYSVHAAETIARVVDSGEGGLFHITNSGQCSWYDLALETIRVAGLTAEIERTQYLERPGQIKRPLHSPLAHQELKRRGMEDLPPWQDAVADYVRQRRQRLSTAAPAQTAGSAGP